MNRFPQLSRRSKRVSASLVYVAIIAATFFVARSRLQHTASEAVAPQFAVDTAVTPVETKPFFSLSTNRTFGSSENPRLWLDHRGIDSLDFRVYRINDPKSFFSQLSDPHQLGDDERDTVDQRFEFVDRH